ncbi:MAG: hypothetical protein FD180_1627 [Planctomycetota bacterium]|nr:MAG: hypothetical protein FD180_1627 [Planctomycetota bacterium]
MGRAFLLSFFAGPLPYFVWTTAVLRTSQPDVIALTLGSLLLTIPWLWFLVRFARRPMFLVCWFATLGTMFWSATRHAILYGDNLASGAGAIALFPITGVAAMNQERLLLVPICLFTWGVVAGFVGILRRSATPRYEREELPHRDPPGEEPPRPEPYVVPRPPPKPKGPAYTPPKAVTPPPRPKRVPGV